MCGVALEAAAADMALVAALALEASEPASPLTTLLPPAPEPAAGQLEGERRVATIVVADVRGSTQLLEQVGTERWVELMNRVLQLLEAEIYCLGGEVSQFRGDGLVAFFGTSAVHEDDPERAVMASLRMQRAVKAYAVQLAAQGLELSLRIGVNTGEVIVTSVGGGQYREDTAMGEAITLAARMEAAAEPGTVLVSENTYRLTQPYFTWEALGVMAVKGLREPVTVYRPLALAADTDWVLREELYRLTPPLIGRQGEFEQLARCVQGLHDGRGGIAMITGEKGMGKSFLVAQVWEHRTREAMLRAEARHRDAAQTAAQGNAAAAVVTLPDPTWLRGRCRSYDQAWPYSMWRDMMQNWLSMRRDEPQEALRDRLREQAEQLWGEHFTDYYPFLVMFLALPLEATFFERVQHLDAESLKRQFFRAIRAWVAALAQRGPLVVFFADMHWVDSTSLELLQHCLPLCDTLPLLWLVVFRPERRSPVWDFRHYVVTEYPHRLTHISIPPLSATESLELLGWLIGAKTLPEKVSQLVLQRAEGNPYYLHELANALIAQGILIRDAETGEWKMTRQVTSLDLPDSLQTLLLARLDRLAPDVRHVLQAAAVIGAVFWQKVLRALVSDEAGLKAQLTQLQREQLIHERQRAPDLGMEYTFSSLLLRDVAYDSLLSAQRAAYHLKAAEALEPLLESGEERAQRYGMVAYHYHQAGNLQKALGFTLKAAEQARQVYANAEALEHYTHALELLDGLAVAAAADDEARYALQQQRFHVLDARRETYYLLGELEQGRVDARAMLELAQRLERDPALLIDALLEQPGVGSIQAREELDAGLRLAQEALERARQLGDAHREMQSLVALSNLYNLRHDPTWQWAGEQALELARRLEDRRAEVKILLRMGGAYGADNLERSRACLEAALPIAQGLHDKSAEIRLLSALGTPLERQGDYYRLLTEIEQKRLQLSREIGDRYAEGSALMACGQIRGLCLGDYEAGLALEEEALRIWENITGRLYPLLRIVQHHTELGNYEAALAALEQAQPAGEREVREMGRAGLGLVSAILFNAIGDEAHLRQALDAAGWVHRMAADNLVSRQYKMAALCEIAAAHLQLAKLAADDDARRAHLVEALIASGAAFDLYQGFGFVQIVECSSEEILFRHGLALQASGRAAEGEDMLRRAHAEMLRKHALIPAESYFRRTYLENIVLHREIQSAYDGLPRDPEAICDL